MTQIASQIRLVANERDLMVVMNEPVIYKSAPIRGRRYIVKADRPDDRRDKN